MLFKIKKMNSKPFIDHRGYLWTSWKKGNYKKIKFNHDKFSLSKKNVLRGLHGDKKSTKYLKWQSFVLSQKNGLQILIPPNHANGHLCLSKECLFHYKLSYKGNYIDAKQQFSIKWNDPRLKIKWNVKKPILSIRDQNSKLLK